MFSDFWFKFANLTTCEQLLVAQKSYSAAEEFTDWTVEELKTLRGLRTTGKKLQLLVRYADVAIKVGFMTWFNMIIFQVGLEEAPFTEQSL